MTTAAWSQNSEADGVKSGGEGKVGGSFNTHKKTKRKGRAWQKSKVSLDLSLSRMSCHALDRKSL